MKKCPFCAEEIQDEAIKCRFCGEFLEGKPSNFKLKAKESFYFKPAFLFVSFICIGPFMLPLVWLNKNLSQKKKIIITIIIVIVSVILGIASIKALASLKDYYGDIMNLLNS